MLASLLPLFSCFGIVSNQMNGLQRELASMPEFSFWIIGFIVVSIFMTSLMFGIFSLLMLADCMHRKFDGKTKWLMIILFFNFFGALGYYFAIKRKH